MGSRQGPARHAAALILSPLPDPDYILPGALQLRGSWTSLPTSLRLSSYETWSYESKIGPSPSPQTVLLPPRRDNI